MTTNTKEKVKESLEEIGCSDLNSLFEKFGFDIEQQPDHMIISHCGEFCNIGTGIMGADTIECKKCGLKLVNVMSPHINGGYVWNEESVYDLVCEAWTVDREYFEDEE